MDTTEDSISMSSSDHSVETDSQPPTKIPRLELDGTFTSSTFSFLADPYPESDLLSAHNESTTTVTVDNPVSVQTKLKDTVVQLNKRTAGAKSSDKLPEHELLNSDLCISQGHTQDEKDVATEQTTDNDDVGLEKGNDEVRNTTAKDGLASLPSVLAEILAVLDQNQTKTSEMIVQEYVSCPKRCLKVKDFLREDIHEFLRSSGEDTLNDIGSTSLKCTLEKAEFSTLIKLLSDACRRIETKITPNHRSNSDNSIVANKLCGSSQISSVSDNVQNSDIADGVRMEEDAGEEIDISTDNVPASCSSSQSPNVVNAENQTAWQAKIDDMLFRTLEAEAGLVSRREKKITKIGKRLLSLLFSEEEILGGFARAKKNIPAYYKTRVFKISQIINFVLNQTDGCSLENFRSSQHENKGLDEGDQETFRQTVMIKFASDERKRIKSKQS